MDKEKYISCKVNGIDKKFRILFVFDSNETKKSYIIYTDDKFDKENKLNVFASILNKNNNPQMEDITSVKDWQIVEEFLKYNTGDN